MEGRPAKVAALPAGDFDRMRTLPEWVYARPLSCFTLLAVACLCSPAPAGVKVSITDDGNGGASGRWLR